MHSGKEDLKRKKRFWVTVLVVTLCIEALLIGLIFNPGWLQYVGLHIKDIGGLGVPISLLVVGAFVLVFSSNRLEKTETQYAKRYDRTMEG
jgi:hypothetical protein